MKKVIKVNNIDCAVCAKNLENAVAKIEGVNSVTVNFMAQKIILDYDENNAEVFAKIKKTAKDLEPDWEFIGI